MSHDTAARDAYNDGELTAVAAVRVICQEMEDVDYDTSGPDLEILIRQQYEKHGPMGTFALVAALARHAATHVSLSADRAGITTEAWLDDWAMHKLAQHQFEDDEEDA